MLQRTAKQKINIRLNWIKSNAHIIEDIISDIEDTLNGTLTESSEIDSIKGLIERASDEIGDMTISLGEASEIVESDLTLDVNKHLPLPGVGYPEYWRKNA